MFTTFKRWTLACVAVTAAACLFLVVGDATASDEIEILDEFGNHKEWYDAAGELDDALGDLLDGETLVLLPGYEYRLPETTVQNLDEVTIEGGYTVRIEDINSQNEFECSENHNLNNGDEIQFFGDVPTELTEGQTYYVMDKTADKFRVGSTPSSTSEIDVSGVDHMLFGMYHANVVPDSSTTSYDHLLKLKDCDYITIKNVTFDGKYKEGVAGYENGFKDLSGSVTGASSKGTVGGNGDLLVLENCDGTTTFTGVHVANNRGRWAAKQQPFGTWNRLESFLAHGIKMTDCGTVNLTNCTGSRTGYNTWRTSSTSSVTYDYCRAENPHHRCIGEGTSDGGITSLTITNCDFVRDEPRETDGEYPNGQPKEGIREDLAYSLVGNINVTGTTRMTNFLMRDCFSDWRNAEETISGTDYGVSWKYYGPDSRQLLKIEGIDTARFEDCKFLHGHNRDPRNDVLEYVNFSGTLKTDDSLTVKRIYLDECELSSGFQFSHSQSSSNDLDALYVRGSNLMVDGNFDMGGALYFVEYPVFHIQKLGTSNPTVDNIGNTFAVIRMGGENFDSTGDWIWNFTDLTAKGVDDQANCWFCWGVTTDTPLLSEVNSNFKASNTFPSTDCNSFSFSQHDTESIIDIVP